MREEKKGNSKRKGQGGQKRQGRETKKKHKGIRDDEFYRNSKTKAKIKWHKDDKNAKGKKNKKKGCGMQMINSKASISGTH